MQHGIHLKMADSKQSRKKKRKNETMISHNENTIKKAKKNDCKSTGASVEQPESEINLLQEIFGMVKDPQKRISGLKKFCQLSRQDKSQSRMLSYLKTYPDCQDLFDLLETEDRPGTEEMKLIWNAFEVILLSATADASLKGVGMLIVNKILTKHIRLLYSAMNPSSPSDLSIAVIKLLTSFLAQGEEGVRDVLHNFDFSLKGMEVVVRRRNKRKQDDTRECFLKLFLGFFIFGDVSTIKETLELEVLIKIVIGGLAKDRLDMIDLVIKTLTDKVVNRLGISKQSKLALFNRDNLVQLANLYVKLNRSENKQVSNAWKQVRKDILRMLSILCTDKVHSILFPNTLGYFSFRSNNPVLLGFLSGIQKLAVTESGLKDLISRTLSAAPDLVIPFLSRLDLNLELKESPQWRNNITFVTEIWNNLPPFHDVDEENSKINLELLRSTIVPKICSKNFFTNGIKHESYTIKQKTLDLILACLERAISFCQFYKKKENNSDMEVNDERFENFLDSILRELPNPRIIINLKKECSELADKEKETPEDGGKSKDTAVVGIDLSELERSILKVMNHLQLLRPGILTAADYNLCKLFHDHDSSMSTDVELANHALSIVLREPQGNLKWLAKKSQIYTDAMRILLTTYVTSTSKEIKDKCEQLIKKIVIECRAVTENKEEIRVWLEVISQCYKLDKDISVIEFFQQILVSCAQDLFSIMSEVLEISSNDIEGDSQELEMVHFTYSDKERFGFTPLVVGALRLFTIDRLKNDEKDKLGSMSRAVCSVLMDILMSQQSPTPLLKVILKYVKTIKDEFTEMKSEWILYWKDLEKFAVYWCFDSVKSKENVDGSVSTHPLYRNVTEDDQGGKPSIMSIASFLHYELFSMKKKVKRIKNFEDGGAFWKDIDAGINWKSNDSIVWSLKVILCTLKKLLQIMFVDAVPSLAVVLKEIVAKCEKLVSKENDFKGVSAVEDWESHYVDILVLVLESPAVKELYFSTSQPHASEAVIEILQMALKHKTDSLDNVLKYYLEKLSSESVNLIRGKKDQSSCFSNTMQGLKALASYLPIEEQSMYLSNILGEIVAFCLNFTDHLLNTRVTDTITHLICFISEIFSGLMVTEERYLSCHFGQKTEQKRKSILSQSIRVTPEKISSLFKLYENEFHSVVEDILVLLLKADPSLAVLASPNIVNTCLQNPSQKSLQLLKIVTHNSPHHSTSLLRNFKEIPTTVPISFLIQIAHTLLSACYNESRITIECTIRAKLCKDLIAVLTCTEDLPEITDMELKMACDVLKAVNKDCGKLLKMLIKSLEVVSSASNVHAKPRYLIKLFGDCILEKFSEQDPDKVLCSLISLMKIWEKSVSVKDLADELELVSTVEACIKSLCMKFIELKYKRLQTNSSEKLINVWTTLLPACLKNCFKNTHSLETLEYLMTFLYGVKRFRIHSTLSLENVYERIFNHSQFFPTLFDHRSDNTLKESVLSLLLGIAKFNPCVFEKSHLRTLLAAYNASLLASDQKLVILLKIYESHGVSALSMRPLKWGKRLLSSTPDANDLNLSTYNHASITEIMDSLDRNMLLKSAFNFPLTLDVTKFDNEGILLSNLRTDLYDPRFLFPIFSYILSSRFTIDCRRFIEHGCLAFTLSALSCQISSTRRAACHILVRFMNHLESAQFREKNQILVLLNALKNTIREEGMILPSVVCCFTLCCLKVIFKPEQQLYGIVNNLLLKKPFLDFRDGSTIMDLLGICSLQNNKERLWIVNLIANGLRTATDYYIYKRSHVFKHLMSLYDSQFCDDSVKEKINDVFIGAARIHPAAFDLVKCHGLLSWILGRQLPKLTKYDRIFTTEVLRNILDTFEAGCKIVDDSGKEEVKKPIPRNFGGEAVILCFSIINKSNENLDIEFLEIFSRILHIGIENQECLIPFSLLGRKTKTLFEKIASSILAVTDASPVETNKLAKVTAKIMGLLLKSSIQREEQCTFELAEYLTWLVRIMVNMVSQYDVLPETLDVLSDTVNIVILLFKYEPLFTDKETWILNLVRDCVIALRSLNVKIGGNVSRNFTNLRSSLKNLLSTLVGHLSLDGILLEERLTSTSSEIITGQHQEPFLSNTWKTFLEQLVDREQISGEGCS